MAKYLDGDGLLYFWQKIKNLFALKTDVPTKVSDLQNDAGYVTSAQAGTTYTFAEGSTNGAFTVTDDSTSTTSTINIHGLQAWAYKSAFVSGDVFSSSQSGIVPQPSSSDGTKFLDNSGSWSTPVDSKVNVTLATTSKAYLLGVTTTPTSTAAALSAVSDIGVYLDTTAGKLSATSFAGNGASLTSLNASNLSSGTVAAARLPAASTTTQGAMSSADKSKLDGFAAATNYALKSDITNMYKYKGSVATASALPTTGQEIGDVYNIETASAYGGAGMNVAWSSSGWDPLGEIFSITSVTNGEIDTIVAS